jgi:palmitoyltransferase
MTSLVVDPDPSTLCCCEYHSRDGERSHLLALCCDCEALDQAVDRMVSGREVKSDMVREIIDVVEERLRFPCKNGAVRIPLGKVLPIVMLPTMVWLATLHPYLVVITFLLLIPSVFLIAVRTVIKHRPQTQFFLFWSYTSASYLFYVYQVKCVGLFWDLPKVISWWENLVLVGGSAVSVLCYTKMRRESRKRRNSDGKMCRICEQHVVGKDHHCVWLDMCISSSNKKTFLLFLTTTFNVIIRMLRYLSFHYVFILNHYVLFKYFRFQVLQWLTGLELMPQQQLYFHCFMQCFAQVKY